ncbi:alkaline phosphatase family protein [Paraburkholderia sp. J7]|uniref:alkaline phosphatase family protein n=1 Tax=Paraburkholderia sp. J7 TaxID=2805438 RepID=UPI002AB68D8A|nr:alkaline phosphatase family protein [Paraburkholderia sp. J7]
MPKINRIFVLMLENRSFDSVFGFSELTGTLPDGTPAKANGLPVGPILNSDRKGKSYSFGKGAPFFLGFDPGHEFTDVCVQLCGLSVATADDVEDDRLVLGPTGYPALVRDLVSTGFCATYGDVGGKPADAFCAFTPDQLPVLNFLANQYAVCDGWFSSVPGPTWPNRFFAVAGTSSGLDNSPSEARVFEALFTDVPVYAFPNGTVFSKLAPTDWLVVQGDVAQARAIAGIHEHRDRFVGMDNFLTQLRAGTLGAKFVYIEPEYDAKNDFRNGNSMHPAGDVRRGEALIKTLYDAISTSAFWPESVFLIVFDEHGGFFDHVRPPPAVQPGAPESAGLNEHNFRFDRYGVRVPAVVISPYVRAGTVDHTIYDHTSILKTTDRLLGLNGALNFSARVRAANDFSKVLSLDAPRADTPKCPEPVAIDGETATSSGAPRAKDPFLPLYAHR